MEAQEESGLAEEDVLPLIGLGTSLVLGVIGVVFAIEAGNALDQQDLTLDVDGDTAELTDEFRDTQGVVIENTILATAFLSAAGSGLVVSLIFLFDD